MRRHKLSRESNMPDNPIPDGGDIGTRLSLRKRLHCSNASTGCGGSAGLLQTQRHIPEQLPHHSWAVAVAAGVPAVRTLQAPHSLGTLGEDPAADNLQQAKVKCVPLLRYVSVDADSMDGYFVAVSLMLSE